MVEKVVRVRRCLEGRSVLWRADESMRIASKDMEGSSLPLYTFSVDSRWSRTQSFPQACSVRTSHPHRKNIIERTHWQSFLSNRAVFGCWEESYIHHEDHSLGSRDRRTAAARISPCVLENILEAIGKLPDFVVPLNDITLPSNDDRRSRAFEHGKYAH